MQETRLLGIDGAECHLLVLRANLLDGVVQIVRARAKRRHVVPINDGDVVVFAEGQEDRQRRRQEEVDEVPLLDDESQGREKPGQGSVRALVGEEVRCARKTHIIKLCVTSVAPRRREIEDVQNQSGATQLTKPSDRETVAMNRFRRDQWTVDRIWRAVTHTDEKRKVVMPPIREAGIATKMAPIFEKMPHCRPHVVVSCMYTGVGCHPLH